MSSKLEGDVIQYYCHETLENLKKLINDVSRTIVFQLSLSDEQNIPF